MTDLFDPIYASKFRELRKNFWEKECDLANELGLRQQEVSLLLNGGQHYTGEIITKICRHYKIRVSEFKRLAYSDAVMAFIRQLCEDAGSTPFNEQSAKIKELEITICLLRKENLSLAAESSGLRWEVKKARRAAEIVAEKIRSKIYVTI